MNPPSEGKHEFAVIGQPLPKIDAWAKVIGETKYADDLVLPRMAYGRLLRSPHPHARIVRIDTSPARALPGVYAVITGADLPRVKFGILPVSQDEEALCTEKVRMVGDAVAAVAAVDEETAERACRLIVVEYEPLPALMSIEESLAHPEVRIHEYGDGPNVHKNVSLQFGDVEAAFAQADLVREDVFFYEGSTHLPMEQHAAVASAGPDGKLTLWSSTQTPHYVHRLLAKILDMPAAHIRVIATPVGGGFGGKLDPFAHEIAACRLSQLTGRPVKIACTREEVFYIHRGRHPVLMWIKTGFTRDGEITGCHLRTWLDGGAYGSYGVASTFYTGAINPVTYKMPVYKFEGARVFTNKPPCGPKRGHGTPQPRFALECQLDKAAEQLGLDPAEMRKRVLAEPFTKTANHLTVTTIGLGECIDRVVEASGWRAKWLGFKSEGATWEARPKGATAPSEKKRGIGIACSAYLTGAGTAVYWNNMPHSGVIVRADRSGGVAVLCGATDVGQGSDSILAYLPAEILGIDPKDVHVHPADTTLTPVDLGSYSSRVTLMCGMAAIQASQRLREVIARAVARKLAVDSGALAFRERKVGVAGDWDRAVPFPQAVELAETMHGVLAFAGSYAPPKRAGKYKGGGVGPSPCYSYSACVVELTVDEETGEIELHDVWIAHDIGRALNPLLAEGQVEGSVYMGIGEALMEGQVFRKGVHKNPSLLEYKSPTTLEIHTFLVETDDPEGPFGAKEAGQGPLLPVIPAIANAVYHAVGVRCDEVPITPEMILRGLERRRQGKAARVGPERIPVFEFKAPVVVESAFGQPADAIAVRPFQS
jgi:4-hydroxybenzoyl-CoA reductase alpha subunit